MKKPRLRKTGRQGEAIIQDEIVNFLSLRGWECKETHGNIAQKGLPDIYCVHPKHKQRWVEVKRLPNYRFTPAQLQFFPAIELGSAIWILVEASETEYKKLFAPPNWRDYLHARDLETIRRLRDNSNRCKSVLTDT